MQALLKVAPISVLCNGIPPLPVNLIFSTFAAFTIETFNKSPIKCLTSVSLEEALCEKIFRILSKGRGSGKGKGGGEREAGVKNLRKNKWTTQLK